MKNSIKKLLGVTLNSVQNPIIKNSLLTGARIKYGMTLAMGLVFGLCLLATIPVSAHVLEIDNGIGAVLHMDPQDEPVAGQQTNFYFAFSDKTGGFNAASCDCNLQIMHDNQILATLPLTVQAVDSLTASYTLPERGVYQLRLDGKPNVGSSFPTFALSYTVRADKGGTGPTTDYQSRAIYVVAAGIGGLMLFLLLRNTITYNVGQHVESSAKKPRAARAR